MLGASDECRILFLANFWLHYGHRYRVGFGSLSQSQGGTMKAFILMTVYLALLVAFAAKAASDEEALIPQHCLYEFYGTTTNGPDGPSDLLRLNASTGEGTLINTITGQGVHRVNSIDFAPNGTLYGVGEDANNASVLVTIHCFTGWAYIIGPTGIPAGQSITITDINFDDNGVLWAYVDNGANDSVGTINLSTGAYTAVGNSGINEQGNALGFGSSGTLYHAGKLNISTINQTTGAATTAAALDFEPPADTNPRISALDRRPINGLLFGSLNDKASGPSSPAENYLVTVNPATGVVSFLASPVRKAPDNLSGIAFNTKHFGCSP